ncbi:Crp/Fnr family transcriptional regulator [Tardiphaga alba]|uniref:Crp/Fnr family transcriptional regulator n=1 Tax=Tardiphaga alba TaxID=340268 RepID=A0ABX8A4K0_9BRAD|nr:Crp/Fnr family transcriptional regulator [Tardiphaga alba]QUS38596.1 Crp/Fnr family transcriptional regulator [Tardiphaga alba]
MTRHAVLKAPTEFDFEIPYFLSQPGAGKIIHDYRKNDAIYSQGDSADTVFFILNGRIKLTVLSEQGKEAVVGLLEAGQFFGECCLNGIPLQTATATAMENCTITSITKCTMLAALRDDPAMTDFFMSYLIARNSRIEEDLADQLFNSSEKRLARLLTILARFGDDGSSKPIDIDISQETLAEMVGTTRSRVSYFMNKFRRLGFISYDDRIQVHESLLDAMMSDKMEPEGA